MALSTLEPAPLVMSTNCLGESKEFGVQGSLNHKPSKLGFRCLGFRGSGFKDSGSGSRARGFRATRVYRFAGAIEVKLSWLHRDHIGMKR